MKDKRLRLPLCFAGLGAAVLICAGLALCLVLILGSAYNPFIYFRF